MGFLQGLTRNLTDRFGPVLAKYAKDKDLLEGAMAATAMISAADGLVEPQEKAKLARFLETHELMREFDRGEAIRLFNSYVQELEFDFAMGGDTCLKQIREVRGDEKRQLVARLAIAIAKADGEFEPEEKTAALKIIDALNLNRSEFGLN